MSFILDALRKSEHERQRSAAPSLSHVPLAHPRRNLPAWAIVVIGALAAAVLVLGGAWWQSQRAPPAAASLAAGGAKQTVAGHGCRIAVSADDAGRRCNATAAGGDGRSRRARERIARERRDRA
jgi:hypothetical protein